MTGAELIEVLKEMTNKEPSERQETFGDRVLNMLYDLSSQELNHIVDYGIPMDKEDE